MSASDSRQSSITETPLVESEREALRAYVLNMTGPDWAVGVLIESALWNLEQAEAEVQRLQAIVTANAA